MRNKNLFLSFVFIFLLIPFIFAATLPPGVSYSDEEIYKAVLDGSHLSTDSQKQQLVDYLNNNPDRQKEFFEKKDIGFEGSGVRVVSYSGDTEGEEIEIKIGESGEDDEFTVDLKNKRLLTKNKVYESSEDSEEKPEIKITEKAVVIKGKNIIEKDKESGKIKSEFSGEVSIYPDGHKELEKDTVYSSFREI